MYSNIYIHIFDNLFKVDLIFIRLKYNMLLHLPYYYIIRISVVYILRSFIYIYVQPCIIYSRCVQLIHTINCTTDL